MDTGGGVFAERLDDIPKGLVRRVKSRETRPEDEESGPTTAANSLKTAVWPWNA